MTWISAGYYESSILSHDKKKKTPEPKDSIVCVAHPSCRCIKAHYSAYCCHCLGLINRGDCILTHRGRGWSHVYCEVAAAKANTENKE